jgi:hypothetical protein
LVSVVAHASQEGGDGVWVVGCEDAGRAVGGGEAFEGAVARVLPGAVDAVEGFGTGGDGCPWVVHSNDLVTIWP